MSTFLADMKKFDDTANNIAREYLDMQITCMILHHAGCLKTNEGDKNGAIILDSVSKMREAVNKLHDTCMKSLGEKEMKNAFSRIGYDKILYSSLSDGILQSNASYFTIAPRPQGAEYRCDEAACHKNTEDHLQKYFSLLWK